MIQENTPTIKTARLVLRKFTLDDLQAYYLIMSDKKTNVYLPWFAVASIEDAMCHLHKNYLNFYGKPSAYRYAICLKEDNIPIGYCGLSGEENNDIGYGLRSGFWHRGIAAEAVQALLDRVKKAGYPFITATHDINNPRSGEVIKKIGMSYRYSYIEQWQPKNIPVTFRMYQLNFDGNNEFTYMDYWNKHSTHFIEEIDF